MNKVGGIVAIVGMLTSSVLTSGVALAEPHQAKPSDAEKL